MPREPAGTTVVSLEAANLPLEQAAELIAVARGLAAIGKLRTGKAGGQLSLHNFRLRAAIEGPANEDSADNTLVILMQAGIVRRHTWFMRVYDGASDSDSDSASDGGNPTALRLELPAPIDADWRWWPNLEEVRDRLIGQDAWLQAVGRPYRELVASLLPALANAQIVKRSVGQGRRP